MFPRKGGGEIQNIEIVSVPVKIRGGNTVGVTPNDSPTSPASIPSTPP
jgi:hypothetical protein